MPYLPDKDDDGPPEWDSWMEGPEARLAREEAQWQRHCELAVIGLLASLTPADNRRIAPWHTQVFWKIRRWR